MIFQSAQELYLKEAQEKNLLDLNLTYFWSIQTDMLSLISIVYLVCRRFLMDHEQVVI